MNRKYIQLSVGFLFVLGIAFSAYHWLVPTNYQPRTQTEEGIDGYFEYISSIRSNQITGDVSTAEISAVRDQIRFENQKATKVDWPISWEFSGPDDVGGRTRCLVLDKDNPKIMYTGGVSGAVFKSTNGGTTWKPLTLEDDNFGVTSMGQTSDGALYYGTGEGGFVPLTPRGSEEGTPGFAGFGIFKSTDGASFSVLNNTLGFGYINKIVTEGNNIYAGTQSGLRHSSDGGSSWSLLRAGNCLDIQISKNNVALAFIGSALYRSTTPSTANSYNTVNAGGIITGVRGAVAFSDSDPNYCYAVTCGNIQINGQSYGSGLSGLFRSTDGGDTWVEEVDQGSVFFAPFTSVGVQSQGGYNMAIAVHPNNKDRVFIGGIGFAEWSPTTGPKMVGSTFDSPTNPTGIHADKHHITFDNTGAVPIMYICTDGGVYKTTNASLTNYASISIGFTTTQFYGIAASRDGKIIAGTQDNNTMLLTKESFPRKNAIEVIGGDGFQTEVSEFDQNVMFGESQYGNLRRSTTGGDNMSAIWDNRISSSFASSSRPNGIFNTPMCMWEDPAIVNEVKTNGSTPELDSQFVARLFFVMNNGIWMCNNATGEFFNPDNPSNDKIRWFRVATNSNIHFMHSSTDGNSLFAGTTNGRIYRIDGLNKANWDTTEISGYTSISDSLIKTDITGSLGVSGRTITSIEVDPSNDDRLVVTVGNYGNSTYVFETTNARDAAPTWNSIQTNLPSFPVYHAVISRDDPATIILGTEFGIWATNNGGSGSPTWIESLTGVDAAMPFPRVPVFELVEVEDKLWSGPIIYAATHGMGIWESSSLTTNVKNVAKKKQNNPLVIYPNPASNTVTLNSDVKGKYNLAIIDMTGKEVFVQNGTTDGTIKVNVNGLNTGNYFVRVNGNGSSSVGKLLIQH